MKTTLSIELPIELPIELQCQAICHNRAAKYMQNSHIKKDIAQRLAEVLLTARQVNCIWHVKTLFNYSSKQVDAKQRSLIDLKIVLSEGNTALSCKQLIAIWQDRIAVGNEQNNGEIIKKYRGLLKPKSLRLIEDIANISQSLP